MEIAKQTGGNMTEKLKSLKDVGAFAAEMNELPLMVDHMAFPRELKRRFNKWRKKYTIPKTEDERARLLEEGAQIIAELEADMPRVAELGRKEIEGLKAGIARMLSN